MILRANQLAYSVDGTIVRIAPIDVLREEAEDAPQAGRGAVRARASSKKDYARSPQLRQRQGPLGAPHEDGAACDLRRDRRSTRTPTRSSSSTCPTGLDRAQQLIGELDRSAGAGRDRGAHRADDEVCARELGLMWGFGGKMTPELGNTCRLVPQSIAAVDSCRSCRAPARSTGAINPTRPLRRRRRSARSTVRSTSTSRSPRSRRTRAACSCGPRVVTQNNIKAVITRGQEIPYTTLTAPPLGDGVTSSSRYRRCSSRPRR